MTSPREDSNHAEVERVAEDVSGRLEELGIWLSGEERPQDLVRILEAVELFEVAVRTRGGDLMVDEPPEGHVAEPDDVHFALPVRSADESIDRYVSRLERAREEVLRHPARE
ncbi:MAG TPA: hypothetical protein VFZ73_14615 [Gemmatimonadaceae bacterium]